MRKILYIITVILTFSFIAIDDKAFEGTVSFKLEYSEIDERLPNDYLCSSSGDSMIYYHGKNGYFQKFYCQDKLIQRRWFTSLDNSLHMLNESDDTLYYYFANETDYNSVLEKTNITEDILGHSCQKYTVTLKPKDGKEFPEMVYDYYITTDLKIDKDPFQNFHDGGYSDLISETPGLILKQTYYGPYYTRTRIAVELTRKKVVLEKHEPTRKLIKKKI